MSSHRPLALVLVASALALGGCSSADLEPLAGTGPGSDFESCSAYGSRSEAERAWRDSGRPPSADGDGDGKVCESLSASRRSPLNGPSSSPEGVAKTSDCERPRRPVAVTYSRAEYPSITDHIDDAQRAGYPRVMRINRPDADERRDAVLQGIPTREGRQRDEYPPAIGRADRAARASVRLVPSAENSSSGASLGAQLADYCDGVRFRFALTP